MLSDFFSVYTIVILTSLLSIITALLFVFYKNNKRSHYDADRHRAQIDEMRSYFESQMHKLTDRLLSTEDRWRDVNHLLISSMQKVERDESIERKAVHSQFLNSFGLTEKDLIIEKDLVFVLTPFNKNFENTYQTILEACRNVGLRCMRGDEEFVSGDLMPHILKMIAKARLVIANIDGRNPNVFYELGIAHAMNKPTVLISSSIPNMPLDLRTRKIVIYKEQKELSESLKLELTRTLVNQP